MKNSSTAAIQFSGYPLTIADSKKMRPPGLVAIKKEVNQLTTSIQKNKITNDPRNWDENWFNGYE